MSIEVQESFSQERVLITAALPYSNNVPHLGNIIGSLLSADVYSRYIKLNHPEKEVIFLSGTDEFGATTEVKAKQEGLTCQEICDKYFKIHGEIYTWFNIHFDAWGRSGNKFHQEITQDVFKRLFDNGFITEGEIKQLYCANCHTFLADRYVKGFCTSDTCKDQEILTSGDQCDKCCRLVNPLELDQPFCVICKGKNDLEIRSSDHLYLALDKLQESVRTFASTLLCSPNARSITDYWLSQKLHPRCITRDLKWGITVPHDYHSTLAKYAGKKIYVWFDAPIAYFSILADHLSNGQNSDWKIHLKSWLKPNTQFVNFMGKDNVQFHSIFFPAMLLGSRIECSDYNFPLVTSISATEYLTYNDQKFSKSNGNGIFGDQVAKISEILGISEDYWRFYLLKIRPESRDSCFSLENFSVTCTADLVNNHGNLVNRCIKLAQKIHDQNFLTLEFHSTKPINDLESTGLITTWPSLEFERPYIFQETSDLLKQVSDVLRDHHLCMERISLREGLNQILRISDLTNKYISIVKPWNCLKVNNLDGLREILFFSLLIVRLTSELLIPFIPRSATYIRDYVKIAQVGNNNLKIDLNSGEYIVPFIPLNYSEIIKKLSSAGFNL